MGRKKSNKKGVHEVILNRLVDIFPQYTRKELETKISRFQINENDIEGETERVIDDIMSDKFVANPVLKKFEVSTPDLSPDEQMLVEMFPNFKTWTLQLALSQHQGILIDCINDITENEERWLKTQKESESTSQTNTNAWQSSEVGRLCHFTNLSKVEAQSYLHKHGGSSQKALADFILSDKKSDGQNPLPVPAAIPMGGRVQRGGGSRSLHASTTIASKAKGFTLTYTYDASSPEAQELDAIYFGTSEFRNKINRKFVTKALEFCNGDIEKALQMMIEVASADVADVMGIKDPLSVQLGQISISAPEEDNSSSSSGEWTAIAKRGSNRESSLSLEGAIQKRDAVASKLQSASGSAHQKSGVTGFYAQRVREANNDVLEALDDEQDKKRRAVLNQAAGGHTVDLHGLDVSHAIQATQSVLSEWWEDEMIGRDRTGHHQLLRGTVRHAQPYTIITGRGIHLKVGVLVVKLAIRRYLESNRYQYVEQLLLFVVTGKR